MSECCAEGQCSCGHSEAELSPEEGRIQAEMARDYPGYGWSRLRNVYQHWFYLNTLRQIHEAAGEGCQLCADPDQVCWPSQMIEFHENQIQRYLHTSSPA